jgi:hypothetical protein
VLTVQLVACVSMHAVASQDAGRNSAAALNSGRQPVQKARSDQLRHTHRLLQSEQQPAASSPSESPTLQAKKTGAGFFGAAQQARLSTQLHWSRFLVIDHLL